MVCSEDALRCGEGLFKEWRRLVKLPAVAVDDGEVVAVYEGAGVACSEDALRRGEGLFEEWRRLVKLSSTTVRSGETQARVQGRVIISELDRGCCKNLRRFVEPPRSAQPVGEHQLRVGPLKSV